MRAFTLAAATLGTSLAIPALAATTGGSGTSASAAPEPRSTMNQAAQPNGQAANETAQPNGRQQQQGEQLRQRIRQELAQGGFTDIHVMPESFLVRAKDPQGAPVMMIINPQSVTSVTAVPMHPSNQEAQDGDSGPSPGSGSMTNSAAGKTAAVPNGNRTPAH